MMDLKYEMAIAELDTAAAILDDLEEPVPIGAGVYIPYHMIWDCRHGHTPCTKIDFAGGKVVFEKVNLKWIPIKTRPMDDEERREWSEKLGYDIEDDEAVIVVSQLPDDGQEVLTCDKWGRVRLDTFFDDDGCYFEDNGDMDGIVAWMPLPEAYKKDEYEI